MIENRIKLGELEFFAQVSIDPRSSSWDTEINGKGYDIFKYISDLSGKILIRTYDTDPIVNGYGNIKSANLIDYGPSFYCYIEGTHLINLNNQ